MVPGLTLLGLVVAAALVVLAGYLAGALALTATCWVAALLRLLLGPRAGTLVVRRRPVDTVLLLGLGLVVLVLATSVPTP